jgi:hypothetical protein
MKWGKYILFKNGAGIDGYPHAEKDPDFSPFTKINSSG